MDVDADGAFTAERARLFAIAYRMLGTASDAEDVVQDTWLRWRRATADGRVAVASPRAYLSRVTTRLSIDRLRALKRQRERYVGPWLPEPVVAWDAPPVPGASESTLLGESLRISFLVLLETLGPVERAVFVLREVFEYEYGELAEIVDKTPANCRQIFARARKRLASRTETGDHHATWASPAGPRRPPAARGRELEALMTAFMGAVAAGDLARVEALLTRDVSFESDHGGKAKANRKLLRGANVVARFLLGLVKKAQGDMRVVPVTVNGQPGWVSYHGGQPHSVVALELEGDKIAAFHAVRNPDKLRAVVGA